MYSSSAALTFALPTVIPEKRLHPPASPTSVSDNFLVRLSRRISQSGATLKRKVSKGQKTPVRRLSEADKENRVERTRVVPRTEGEPMGRGDALDQNDNGKGGEAEGRPPKGTLKRGLRVSVMRRTKSEGTPRGGRVIREASQEVEELAAAQEVNEDRSEVSSHRGSYFYSNSLGVCWDGRERGQHPFSLLSSPSLHLSC
jgi:hypothetical protein